MHDLLRRFAAASNLTEASLKDTPLIALPANAMPRDIELGLAAGFTDYLTKPLDVSGFMNTVNRCLAGDTS